MKCKSPAALVCLNNSENSHNSADGPEHSNINLRMGGVSDWSGDEGSGEAKS